MSLLDLVLGRPLATSEERGEKIGVSQGVPIFGLDALGSAAYGPEAALTLLIPLGAAGLAHIVPLNICIIVLLVIVFFSYRQTIEAYPQGGGSYTVARENLGTFAGLLAATALLIDYVLDAVVGISAGIGALTSAIPSLHPRTLTLCLAALALLTVVNLRGVRDTGFVFLLPTYLFLASMAMTLGWGIAKALAAGGHPQPAAPLPASQAAATAAAASIWLLLKAFASGCTALTGVEAVSNGVRAFREPKAKVAQQTLTFIIAALVILLAGIAYLVRAYKIVATEPNGPNYQSLLSMLISAVAGRGIFYYIAIGSVLLVLIFSANTAFADFPRVCRVIAEDGFLPSSFANRGRRLVYSEGILVLAILAAVLLVIFGGITDRLIPLFAVGAFGAFTLSQTGMVAHWRRRPGPNSRRNMVINALGAVATGTSVLIIIVAKFTEGAWIVVFAIPLLLALMYSVHLHYKRVLRAIESPTPLELGPLDPPMVVLPIQHWSRVAKSALHFSFTVASEIKAVYVASENSASDEFCSHWREYAEQPARQANLPVPELVVLQSPYRFIVRPIVDYVVQLANDHPDRRIVLVVPRFMEKRWYHWFLHNQRSVLLVTELLMRGNERTVVLNAPWYLKG